MVPIADLDPKQHGFSAAHRRRSKRCKEKIHENTTYNII
jgi:hypothetical protein